ncbi:MAG: response regulator, partial [Saprospiraceae bacterium]|nr:response regulator [Saprospiraceae bacterium]
QYEPTIGAVAEESPLTIAAEREAPETASTADRPNILLVEDNPDVVAYTASCLQGQYNIQVGKDGQEGIEMAIENIPDLIITDVMMPIKDGFEVCHTLKTDERTSHIPIIMLTAKADMDSKIEGLERGADAYLAKPFNKEELLVRVKKLLELREKLQKHYLSIAGSNTAGQLVEESPEAPTPEDQFVLKLREVVDAHLDDFDFTVEQFCREVAMSHSQLLR